MYLQLQIRTCDATNALVKIDKQTQNFETVTGGIVWTLEFRDGSKDMVVYNPENTDQTVEGITSDAKVWLLHADNTGLWNTGRLFDATKYIYGNGSQILAEADGAGVITRYYIYGHGLVGFYVPGTGYFTCHYDLSGNMAAITDDTGAVAARFAYTPFGEVLDRIISNTACDIPIGFAGAFGVMREPNGLYYMTARYYDPSIGRFLSEDPLGLGGGDVTLYSYAGNNPVVFVDPSGLCATSSVQNPNWGVIAWGASEVIGGGLSLYSSGGTSVLASYSLISIGISNIILGATGNNSFEKVFNTQLGNINNTGNPKIEAYIKALSAYSIPSLVPNVAPEDIIKNGK